MKCHPNMKTLVLAHIKGRWRKAYHMGTVTARGEANYFVLNHGISINNPKFVGGVYWLMPDQVKPIPPRKKR